MKKRRVPSGDKLAYVEVAKIDLSPRPRNHPTQLNVKKRGFMQSVLLRRKGPRYEVVAGEGRVKDAKRSHIRFIPAIIRAATDKQAVEFRFLENTARDDFSPVELGEICAQLQKQGYSDRGIAELSGGKLHKTKISESIQIYEATRKNIKAREAIESGQVHVSDVEALLDLTEPGEAAELIAQHAAGKVDIRAIIERADQASKRVIASESTLASIRNEPAKFYEPPKMSAQLLGIKLKPEQQQNFLDSVRTLPPDQSKYAHEERENPRSLKIGGQEWFTVTDILRLVLRRTEIKLNGEITVSGECEQCGKCTHLKLDNQTGRIHLESVGFAISRENIPKLSEALKQAIEKLNSLILEVQQTA